MGRPLPWHREDRASGRGTLGGCPGRVRGQLPVRGQLGGQKWGRGQDPSPRSPGHQGQKSGSVTQAGKQEGVPPTLAGQGHDPVFCWDIPCLLTLETQLPFTEFVRNILSRFCFGFLPLILF